MFDGWGNYYFLLGSAAAALVGVMSLVATLTGGSNPERAERGQRLFLTPNLFHLAAVLTLSALALVPNPSPGLHRLLLGSGSLFGLGYALVVLIQIIRAGPDMRSHWSDIWCYGAAPAAAFLVMAGSVFWSLTNTRSACEGLGFGILALLLTAVRNAWDLVTWLAPTRANLAAQQANADRSVH